MKNYYRLSSIVLLFIGITFFSGCSIKPGADIEVSNFLNKFNNQEFLIKLEKQRSVHYEMVRNLKSKGYDNADLKLKYVDTQRAFNTIIDKMVRDFNGVSNIVMFKLQDPGKKYNQPFADAREVGDKFLIAGNATIDEGLLTTRPALGGFVVNTIWPLIQKVHNKYLKHVQMKMENELNRLKFDFWENI